MRKANLPKDCYIKRVVFVSGKPDSGKSYLAEQLVSHHMFTAMSLDALYVEFVRSHVPMLFFPALKKYVGNHYDHLLSHGDYSMTKFGRNFSQEWREWILSQVKRTLSGPTDRVVVEGYLLWDCLPFLKKGLAGRVRTFEIVVVNRKYRYGKRRLTADQIATLGSV